MSVLARTAAALGRALGMVTARAARLRRHPPDEEPRPPRTARPGAGARPAAGPAAPAVVGTLAGIVLAVAVFLPWYATNLGPPFSTGTASGWSATSIAQAAFALGLVVIVASVALALEALRLLSVRPEIAVALAWLLLATTGVALALVAYRLLVPPEPAALLSRDWGLYLAGLAALAGLVAGVAQISTRH